jgi:hypothetical protein
LFSIAATSAALWLLAQAAPEAPPAEWGGTAAHVTVEVSQERLPEAVRFTYTVRYVSASTTGPPIVRIDVGARAFAGAAELETPPISVESPPGWETRVIPDRSRPRVKQVAWSCAEDWERCLAHHIKAGQVRSGFRVIVPDGRGYETASYVVQVDPAYGSGAPHGLTGRVRAGNR